MTKKELLDKWYGKKFKWEGRTYTCEGIDIAAGELIFYNDYYYEYVTIDPSIVEEVKEPRIIYVNEYEDGIIGWFESESESKKFQSQSYGFIRTIKFKECVEE